MKDPEARASSLRSSMVSGAVWMIGMRWVVRGIGLLSTLILVRLLLPEDFGLIAMSMLVISFLEVVTSFGVDLALIQRADAGNDHLDTAWTIRLVQMAAVCILVVVSAPFAADHFDEPRIVPLMLFLAGGVLISGFANIGVVAFRKELDFSKEFQYRVATKIGGFIITISLALYLRTYWALAWGIVFGHMVAVVMSYLLHPYRPSFSLKKFRDLWSFSQWMLLRNMGMYIRRRMDGFLVAAFFNTNQMGIYSVSTEISQLPTTELIWPMARAFFPGYAKIADDTERLGKAYLTVLNGVALISIPAGVGLALVARPLVNVAFGESWTPMIPILQWLSLYGVVLTVSSGVQTPLIALGMMRRVVLLVWTQMLLALPFIAWAATREDLELIALAQLGTAVALLPLFFFALTSLGLVRWRDILSAVWRPVVASAVMALPLLTLPVFPLQSPLGELIVKVAAGAALFIGTDLALWTRVGRPDGGERLLIQILSRRFGRAA